MPAPRKYDEEIRDRAIRMYEERYGQGDISQNAACKEIGELLGISGDTLRNWIRSERKKTDASSNSAGSSQESLDEENAQLVRANEVLKTSSAFSPQRSSTANSDANRLHPSIPEKVRGRADLPGAHRAWHPDRPVHVLPPPVPRIPAY